MQQYTNDITPEIRESFSQPSYDKDFFALCDNQTRATLEKVNRDAETRALTRLFRVAVVGNARIMQGASAALVGSMLDNGDEIISTPQSRTKRVFREGEALPEGLLIQPGSKH